MIAIALARRASFANVDDGGQGVRHVRRCSAQKPRSQRMARGFTFYGRNEEELQDEDMIAA